MTTSNLYKELRYNENISKVSKVVFSLLSPEEIRNQSTCKVETHALYAANSEGVSQPVLGGLYDQRMGVIDNNIICNTCEQNSSLCPGHFGHIELAKPIFHMHFMTRIIKILKCICFRCSKMLYQHTEEIDKDFYNSKEDIFEFICDESKKIKECSHCGAIQPSKYPKEGVGKLYAQWTSGIESKKVLIRAEYVLKIFSRISDADIERLQLDTRFCRPEWLICTVLPVPPPSVRPSVKQDNNQRSDDDLTYKLIDIVKTNEKLKKYTERNDEKDADLQKTIDEHTALLQYHCATLINNETPFGSGIPKASVQRSGRNLKSIQERVKSKEGRIRGNLMGKRVDFSARSVITPDPLLGIDELGVPIKIAMNLTYPEKVTKDNLDSMKKCVMRGYNEHPGAKSIVIFNSKNSSTNMKNLRHINLEEAANKLKVGDIVNRHIRDGDIVLFNRQPSLHRMSMMAHKIKIMKADTFRLNVCVTTPYNADFDGDEMNMHVPQSLQTISELKHLAMVNTQIISPQEGTPIIGLVQDALLGSNRITMKNNNMKKYLPVEYLAEEAEDNKTELIPEFIFNERQINNLMMFNDNFTGLRDKNNNFIDLGKPYEDKNNKKKYWTGQQVFSSILPTGVNILNKDIKIINGNLINTKSDENNQENGLDKKQLGKSGGGLVHVIFNDLGREHARDYLNNNQRVVNNFMLMSGFSVGVSDLIADEDSKKEIKTIIKEKKYNVSKITDNIRNGLIERRYEKTLQAEFETLVTAELNKAMSNGSLKAIETLDPMTNNIVNMIKSGSKGSDINLGQMIACLGQQSIDGKRVPYHFNNRTLPHFSQYDNTPESRGFIENNFYKGLTPYEYYFHAMSGRVGIIDTAVKTAETGYIQRRLIKSMEDVKVNYDNTVRNHNDEIVQFLFGEDGMDSCKLEKQELNLLLDNLNNFKRYFSEEFFNNDYFKLKDYFAKAPELDKNPVLKEKFNRNYDELLKQRIFIQNNFNTDKIFYPLNFRRIINNSLIENNIYTKKIKSDLSIEYIFDEIEKLIEEFKNPFEIENPVFDDFSPTKMFAVLLRIHLSPFNIVIKNNCNKNTFDNIINKIKEKIYSSIAEPGDNVGTITAQSIGEPATQMTLNTFHYAGVSSKSNVTRGVPRLKELLNCSKTIKKPSTTIYLDEKIQMDDIQEIKKISNTLVITKIRDIIKSTSIYFDPDPANSLLKKYKNVEQKMNNFKKLLGTNSQEEQNEPHLVELCNKDAIIKESPFILDLEFSKKRLLDKDIDPKDIISKIYSKYSADLKCIIPNANDDQDETQTDTLFVRVSTYHIDDSYDDNICVLKLLEKDILDIDLKGISGLENYNIRKNIRHICREDVEIEKIGEIEKIESVIIDTDGTNLLDILVNDNKTSNINVYQTISNDIQEIYSVLGVEAARTVLTNEIMEVIEAAGSSINPRHILLLADIMTFSGGLMSIDRFGINKSNYGPLAKSSFEEMTDQIFKSAVFGEEDHCNGISANVIFGQEGHGGTGMSDMYFDENKYLKTMMDRLKEENEEENEQQKGGFVQDLFNEELNFDDDIEGLEKNQNSLYQHFASSN